ncbi:choice-of-anchor Q domain-containing protein [Taibaiella chishuiensis]|uniref:Putative secreted protein (Por secretion system target) n=1 Tax=Taibaiella chishuiensis TaxID=1434707 RepID=A0A2P8DDK7_9BACT|nr:choice-of-anchor Q domain-containing protein [Taibaiella chishuiensis]PSK95257.1 putative secreted protein (Por secretion system target) [Taibaiella chishuiensis]
MKKNLVFLAVLAGMLLHAQQGKAQNKWYVDSAATGANNGTSWVNAFRYLSDATHAARSSSTSDTIFVAKGTYYATGPQSGTNRDTAFIFTRGNLAVLAGYPTGGGTVRNAKANPVILSANIGLPESEYDNGNRVVVVTGSSGTPIGNSLVFDGLRLQEARTNYPEGATMINNQYIKRNHGGWYNRYASPTILNTTISSNKGIGVGGMYNIYASPVITNTMINGNEGNTGGMLNDSASSPVMTNMLIAGNVAYYTYGGVYSRYGSSPVITNTTIASNYGVGLANFAANPVIRNSIIYGNSQAAGITNVTGAVSAPVISNSIVQGSGGSAAWLAAMGTDAGNNLDANPLLLNAPAPTGNGTTAGNFRITTGSPAINAGSLSGVTAYLPATDIAGAPRVQDGTIDIGAYEFTPPEHIVYVDSSATSGNNTGLDWANAFTTLSTALNVVASSYNYIDTILVAKGTYYPTGAQNGTNRDSAFFITRSNLAIVGGYPTGGGVRDWKNNRTLLSGDIGTAGTKTDNSYHVVVAAGTSTNTLQSVILDGVTISNAYSNNTSTGSKLVNGQPISRYTGGGMHNVYANPKIVNSLIVFNESYLGAGMYNRRAAPWISNVAIKANSAAYSGAAMYNDSLSSPLIVNTVMNSNEGLYAAIYNRFATLRLFNSSLSDYPSIIILNTNYSDVLVQNSIIYEGYTTIDNSSNLGSCLVRNSIVKGSGGSAAWVAARGTDGGNNLDVDPNFVIPMSTATGPIDTRGNLQIHPGSPAMNAGDTTGISQYLPATDNWGNARIYDGIIDIGAFEVVAPNHVIYVDSTATSGANNGTSWSNAFRQLSWATQYARFFPGIDTILIAKGNYYPTGAQSATNRDSAFVFTRGNLALVGGYPNGGGTRDTRAYPVILNGNIGAAANQADNSYHVIAAVGQSGSPIDTTLIFDGLTVTGGYANNTAGAYVLNGATLSQGNGAGAYNHYASPKFVSVKMEKDTAMGKGGGIYNYSAAPRIINSTVSLNYAGMNGGGIYDTLASACYIYKSEIRGNKAANNGGGLYNHSSPAQIINSLFSGNSVNVNGGAICNVSSTPVITNTTIAGNYATSLGGGIINLSASHAVIKNSVVYGNNSPITNVASTPSVSYSLVQGGAYAGSNNNINQDPLFSGPVTASLTATAEGVYHLLAGSPAINAGDTTGLSQVLPATDLGSITRILGSGIDMGAYEYVRALYVDSSIATPGPGSSWNTAFRYLSDATDASRYRVSVDTIYVARGTYYPTAIPQSRNRDSAFIFTRSKLAVWGGYPAGGGARDLVANPTVLSGDIGNVNDTADNAFHVVICVGKNDPEGLDSTLVFDGLRISNGNANAPTYSSAYFIIVNTRTITKNRAGGMYNLFASPTISNVSFTNNYAYEEAGAMYDSVSSPIVRNSSFRFNATTGAGPITGVGGAISNVAYSSPTFTNVVISDNIAAGNGGGMANNVSMPRITNATFERNKSAASGGAMYNYSTFATSRIADSRMTGNTAQNSGGAIYNFNDISMVIDNCTLNQNTATTGDGGAISNYSSTTKVFRSRISGNRTLGTSRGGAIYSYQGSPLIINCVISGNKSEVAGAAIFNSAASATIVNTVISGNSSGTGTVLYTQSGSGTAPKIKNSIIYGNSGGISGVNSTNIANSIVQGSGGSGSWNAGAGVNGGGNLDVVPNFVQPRSYTSAPDTAGIYSITTCSRAVNAGDTAGIGQYLFSGLDIAGNPRFKGAIDMGAYEIDSLDVTTMLTPELPGTYVSNRIFRRDTLIHFCNCDSNKLLLTLDTTGTGAKINPTGASLKIGSAIASYYQMGDGFVTDPAGTILFNREWSVLPLVQPSTPVTTYFYYTDNDFNSVNAALNSLSMPPLLSDTQMYFYKVTDPALGQFPSVYNIGVNQVQIINHGSAPAVNAWIGGYHGLNKYAKFKVASFSGGGGGSGAGGGTPLAIQLFAFGGEAKGSYNQLNWETSSDVKTWTLSRSNDGSRFEQLAQGLGYSTGFRDENPLGGTGYYQLKITDIAGRSLLSKVVPISRKAATGGVTLYPVPATQRITLHCTNDQLLGKTVYIFDNTGKTIRSFILEQEGSVDVSGLAAGVYLIQLPDGTSMKMIKQ